METIKSALKSRAIRVAINGLVGCPAGGWAETDQAIRHLCDELPDRSQRNYSVSDLIDAALVLDHADRYRWR